jgi:FkbM family methyltransferase
MTASIRTLRLGHHEFNVTRDDDVFWDQLERGQWEPETLAILDHYIGPDTLHLDIGTWIGPTLLYAAERARLAVGFEPDPVAFARLAANLAVNPRFKNIQVHRCAIAARAGELKMGSQSQPGDSMSSALFASQAHHWTAPAKRLEDFAREWPADGDCFVKIDIEGGEFVTFPALAGFLMARRATVFLSLHQGFFLKPYLSRGFWPKLHGELRLFFRILRFYPLLRRYPFIFDEHGRRLTAFGFLHRRCWRRINTLLLAHRPPMPWPSSPG